MYTIEEYLDMVSSMFKKRTYEEAFELNSEEIYSEKNEKIESFEKVVKKTKLKNAY